MRMNFEIPTDESIIAQAFIDSLGLNCEDLATNQTRSLYRIYNPKRWVNSKIAILVMDKDSRHIDIYQHATGAEISNLLKLVTYLESKNNYIINVNI